MNNNIEKQQQEVEVKLEDMELLQDEELQTITGGAISHEDHYPPCRVQK